MDLEIFEHGNGLTWELICVKPRASNYKIIRSLSKEGQQLDLEKEATKQSKN
jgi:hypothetical protein